MNGFAQFKLQRTQHIIDRYAPGGSAGSDLPAGEYPRGSLERQVYYEWMHGDDASDNMRSGYEEIAKKAAAKHLQSIVKFRENTEMVRDLQDALKLVTAERVCNVQMPLLDPRARCFQVQPGDFCASPKFCAGLILPGDDETVLAELLVTVEASEELYSDYCSDYADAEHPSGKMTRDVTIWMKDAAGGSASTLCTMSFGDTIVDPDSGPQPSLANATISFSKPGMQQVKQHLQIDETTSDFALVRLWLLAVACSNQQPPDSKFFIVTGSERKLTLQLNTLQAFMDATTEGGSRRAHEAAPSGRHFWWFVMSWAEGIAGHWGMGNAVNKNTQL